MLRRAARPEEAASIALGEHVFDVKRGTLSRDGAPVRLTSTEAELLRVFARHPRTVLSRADIVALGVGTSDGAGERTIDVHIARLRRKIRAGTEESAHPADRVGRRIRPCGRTRHAMLKRLLPQTLMARTILIIVAPVVLLLAIATLVFYERHWDTVTRRLALGVAGDVAVVIDNLDRLTETEILDAFMVSMRRHLLIDIEFAQGAVLAATPPAATLQNRIVDRMLTRALSERLSQPFQIDTAGQAEHVEILVQMERGVLTVTTRRERVTSSTTYVFILWMVGTSTDPADGGDPVSAQPNSPHPQPRPGGGSLRQGPRPPRLQTLGRHRGAPGGPRLPGHAPAHRAPYGSAHRNAGGGQPRSANAVDPHASSQSKCCPTDGKRTTCTRMSPKWRAWLRDTSPSPAARTWRWRWKRICRCCWNRWSPMPAAPGRRSNCKPMATCRYPCIPNAFRRCMTNLVDNARRYATHVAISAKRRGAVIEIAVDDDGPGIPPENREEVFRPFRRLEESRNPETGGSGLGLAIARDVIRSHGGEIILSEAPLGGLRALLRLPV